MITGKMFGGWIRSYRKANQLSLQQMSQITGVPVSRLSAIENGQIQNPSLRYFVAFAKALRCRSLIELFAELEGIRLK